MAYRIPRETWNLIESKIRRYPENKAEYEIMRAEIEHPYKEDTARGNGLGNPTENTAVKLSTDARLRRIERDIRAVEKVYGEMMPEYQKIIRVRFWSYRYSNVKYFDAERKASYSKRQMIRIVNKFVRRVGEELGEI